MNAQHLASRYGLTTADRLPPKPKPPEPKSRDRWPAEKKRMFQDMAWAAVYIAGNDGPEPRYFGDNMGAWPVLLGITQAWEDNVTRNMDRMSPFKQRGVLFRAWTPSFEHAHRLLSFIEGYLKDRIEQGSIDRLRGPWLDFGQETDLGEFEREIHALAARKGIASCSDADVSDEVDRRLRHKSAKLTKRDR